MLLRLNLLAAVLSAALLGAASSVDKRQSFPRMVFCHFMIGIESDRTSSADYDADMIRAKSYGIDAFALNMYVSLNPPLDVRSDRDAQRRFVFFLNARPTTNQSVGNPVDTYTDQQLGFAYDSANRNGMKVFISYDFNWWNTDQGAQIGTHMAGYAALPAQLFINGAAFVSSFAGDGVDVNAMRSAAGRPIMFVPNFHPGQGNFGAIDGALNWVGWPSNGNNKAPTPGANVSVAAGDSSYKSALGGKPYLAPASAWFSTHYGPEFTRWNDLLALKPEFVEIVTWNDYGESHYVGPLSSKHQDDGASKWVNDMPHNGWLDMAKPFIAAYKAGALSPNSFITSDQIIYWYRPTLSTLNCDATDTTANTPANNGSGNYFEGRPDGWQTMQDAVFVVMLLTSAGTLTVNSGGQTHTFNAPAGASSFTVPMAVGQQSFALARNGVNVLAANSLKDISNVCPCGLYNFNPYVGSPRRGSSRSNLLPIALPPDFRAAVHRPWRTAHWSADHYTPGTFTLTTTPPTTTPPITTPPTTTPPTQTGSCTITASEQIRPTNCLQPGCVWQGPAGQGSPDHCDG
ncbi:glycosyl hydrolase family 71-domain-containing protein [Roridomyces roridus]|uniref:Glycosyl hydrolase family 71-domain-containing protein n=1 Tax=Roridomyces roridus TaxID=1738132 RepID=A0AAD7FSU3_9AGAR|nr:glycosyl hydrolase family 71-domain-containing protein [Roridomyces roridus]